MTEFFPLPTNNQQPTPNSQQLPTHNNPQQAAEVRDAKKPIQAPTRTYSEQSKPASTIGSANSLPTIHHTKKTHLAGMRNCVSAHRGLSDRLMVAGTRRKRSRHHAHGPSTRSQYLLPQRPPQRAVCGGCSLRSVPHKNLRILSAPPNGPFPGTHRSGCRQPTLR
jgi:hypothetical protein